MTLERMRNRAPAERIDANRTLDTHGHNVPGHEDRMKAHCERIQKEYHDLRSKDGRFYKQYRDKRNRD